MLNEEQIQNAAKTLDQAESAREQTRPLTLELRDMDMDDAYAVQKAWIDYQVPQCGYCQSGMQMAAAALLEAKPNPTDKDIDSAITD